MKQRTVRRTALLGFVVVVLARLPRAPASAASAGQVYPVEGSVRAIGLPDWRG